MFWLTRLRIELSDREKFGGIRGEVLVQILYFPISSIELLFILTSPSVENREK